ncbi:MAG: cytochrome c [Chloroflexi bacterium]|nr:cytochrome c [Chloroflexota bacterium]
MSNMKPFGFLGLIASVLLMIAACGDIYGGDTPDIAQPSTTPASSPTPASGPLSEGQRLFTANNCSACHGSDGQGSDIAPGLAGHTGAQVLRQARAPLGQMPVFPPSQISNEELSQIAEYIESLGGDHAHMKVNDLAQASAQHHWMTLFALEDDSPNEAVHHIGHIISLVTGQHLSQMNDAKAEIESGNLHEGIHIIENMLAGVQLDDLTPSEMHAALARSSALVDDADGALHHVDHISEALSGDPAVAGRVAEIRELLKSGDLADAAHELEELVGAAHEEEHEEDEGHGH